MVSAINTAVNALNNAGKQLENSAKKIASANFDASNPTNGGADQPDIASELINVNVTSYNFKANLKVIKAADDMMKSLLDIKT